MYNLKGFIVANGVTEFDEEWDMSMTETLFRYNIIPAEWYNVIKDNRCDSKAYAFNIEEPDICGKYLQNINRIFDQLNPYDLLRKNYDVKPQNCTNSTSCTNVTNEADYGTVNIGGYEVTYPRGIY